MKYLLASDNYSNFFIKYNLNKQFNNSALLKITFFFKIILLFMKSLTEILKTRF